MSSTNSSTFELKCSPLPRLHVSTFALSMFLSTLGVLVTTVCVVVITTVFSEQAGRQMAEQATVLMTEKSTLRVKGVLDRAMGVASASQAAIITNARARMPYQDNASSWNVLWQMLGMTSEKALGFHAHAVSFFFDDGSYLAISGTVYIKNTNGTPQRLMMSAYMLGNNTPPVDTLYQNSRTKVVFYDYATLKYVSTTQAVTQIDSRLREGYNKSMPVFSSTWSSAVMSFDGKVPTVKLSYSIFNASYIFLGIGEVQLRLDTFDDLVKAERATPNTNVFVLDRHRIVLGQSVIGMSTMTNLTVPITYQLTDADNGNGCSLVVTSDPSSKIAFLICLRNAINFGYKPLRAVAEEGLIPAVGEQASVKPGILRKKLGDLGYYYLSIIDNNAFFPELDWVTVIIVPEKEILDSIWRGRNIAIGVSIAIAVCVAIGSGLLMRLLLRPLAEIVFRMRSAAYLKEEGSSTSPMASSDESIQVDDIDMKQQRKHKKLAKAAEAAMHLADVRVPSYLSDVAAIQKAYWGMADELSILRSYIPEHIRDQLLATRNKPKEGGGSIGERLLIKDENDKLKMTAQKHDGDDHSMASFNELDVLEGPNYQQSIFSREADNGQEWLVSTSSGANVSSSVTSQKKGDGNNISQNQHESSGSSGNKQQKRRHSTQGQSEEQFEAPKLMNSDGDLNSAIKRKINAEGCVILGRRASSVSTKQREEEQPDKTILPTLDLPPISAKASTRQAAKFASLGNISDVNDARTFKSSEPLPLFTENGLVERNITVALINLTGFHNYVFSTPTSKVIKEHEYFVNYLHEVAKRCGGVLDNFNGDKFWVSFNASAPCDEIYVAATLFAYEVASKVNREASLYQQYLEAEQLRPSNLPPLSPQRPRFHIALRGVTIGVATGQAFVGPLGTKNIRRLTITSNALSEASALERMAARYPDCDVMVGGDMIPAIEGYFQYMLLDATALPGSGGLRRRIASIKGCMLAPNKHHIPQLLESVMKSSAPLQSRNPFETINSCFNAFLEGRIPEVVQKLGEVGNYIALSRQVHLKAHMSFLPDGRPVLTPLECNNISIMIQFMSSVGDDVDGRQYRSPLGDLFERVY